MKIRAISNRVIVEQMEKGEQKTHGGIVIPDDNGKLEGIRPRWGKVLSIGPEVSTEIKEGQWICVEHGRWTRPMEFRDGDVVKTIYGIEEESILLVSDEKPVEFAARY